VEATGRLPNPSPGGWQGARPAANRLLAGATGHAWRGVTGSRPLLCAAGEPQGDRFSAKRR